MSLGEAATAAKPSGKSVLSQVARFCRLPGTNWETTNWETVDTAVRFE